MSDTVVSISGRSFAASATLADGEEFRIDPAESKTGSIELHQIAHGAACDVELVESSTDTGYNPTKRITLDSFSGEGVSQGNELEASDQGNLFVVITNTSGGEADFIVTGEQVSP
jgi:hypothetical protein